jgi:hypothetical protein
LALNPRSFFNFSTKAQEYYYFFTPTDDSFNRTQCLTTGILNAVATRFTGSTAVFDINSLCTTCIFSKLESRGLIILGKGGQSIDTVKTDYLKLDLATKGTSTIPEGSSCTNSDECKSKGFDCCSFGQCIDDKTERPNIDKNSNEFKAAEADILLNPNAILNYPNFYFICAQEIPDANPIPEPIDAAAEQAERFTKMRELYECTSAVENEKAICTVNYTNASKNLVPFITGKDDRNFTTTYSGNKAIPAHSIVSISHGGETLFENGTTLKPGTFGINGAAGIINAGNDTLTDPITITLNHIKDESAKNDDLKIRYMIDGSCDYVNANLAKCRKYYMQGQNAGLVDDHFPASNIFVIPYYADLSRNVKVTVDGDIKFLGSDYSVTAGTPNRVTFLGVGLKIFDTQQVVIEYFVNLPSFNVMQGKLDALNQISQMCSCNGPSCKLKEVYNSSGSQVIDYACVYPENLTVKFPLQVTFSMSAKTVPLLYHDSDGNHHLKVDASILPQEGKAFAYTNGNPLKPNNINTYIGFNEIYGSISFTATAAKAPSVVQIERGKTYDIFIDRGSFTTCTNCGNDYWSSLVKLFPSNFTMNGGGYRPSSTQTSKITTNINRADDLIFGRACWLPASMLPWTHVSKSDKTNQRRARMAGQHFLFANGYQRDWYGFDYGSIIASFDGMQWFAVGNQRRIKSTSTKLYVAVNAYFADQTTDSSFVVTVSEAALAVASGSQVTLSDKNDGAECRQYHGCEVDQDCAAQLGWEYSCENVSVIKTNWPMFDVNGRELPNGIRENVPLTSLFSENQAGKRCVYRGRGALCVPAYSGLTENDNHARVATTGGNYGVLACAPNYYCQKVNDGSNVALFNNKIARFARSPRSQNLSSDVLEDTLPEFGLGARQIGRPLKYDGDENIANSDASASLNTNKVKGICLPGKDPNFVANTFDTYIKQHQKKPTPSGQEQFNGDQVLGQGVTRAGDNSNDAYLMSCPILDGTGTYLYKQENYANRTVFGSGSGAGTVPLRYLAASQATTTGAMRIFNSGDFQDIDLLQFFNNTYIEDVTYQENRCLRTTGSVCHTDQDCVANEYISDFIKQVDITSTDWDGVGRMNSYEVKYWQNELICSQKALPTEPTYKLKNNRCCRASNKEFHINQREDRDGSPQFETTSPDISTNLLYPIDQILFGDNQVFTRNSQLSTYILERKAGSVPQLVYPRADQCGGGGTCMNATSTNNQFETMQLVGKRTCCSGHWIRHFHDDNGAGHEWVAPAKFQSFDIANNQCLNWSVCSGATCGVTSDFICDTETPQDSGCTIRNIIKSEANTILDHFSRLELLGIPQVPIKSSGAGTLCSIVPGDISTAATAANPIPGTLNIASQKEILVGADQYYSAADPDNFDGDMRQIWSKDQFSCCLPPGTDWSTRTEPHSFCCTGFVGEASGRCSIPDSGNVSLYFNKFISSIGQDLILDYDEETGNPNDIDGLLAAACTLKVCNSGLVGTGMAYHSLKAPGHDSENFTTNRFVTNAAEFENVGQLFEAGIRWNNQVYCLPASAFSGGTVPQGMRFRDCNGL